MSLVQSEIDLVSQAIAECGSKTDLTVSNQSNNAEGIKANLFFAPLRNALQRSYEWNFCSDRLVLCDKWKADTDMTTDQHIVSEDGDLYKCNLAHTTPSTFQADNVYYNGLPCVYEDKFVVNSSIIFNFDLILDRPSYGYAYRYLLPADFDRLKEHYRKAYEHRHIVEGQYILSRDTTVRIEYIKKVTDPSLWDSLFTELFKVALAIELLPAIGGSSATSLDAKLQSKLIKLERQARTVCSSENNEAGNHAWNDARFTSGLEAGITRVAARIQPLYP